MKSVGQVQSSNPWRAGDMAYALHRYEVALFLGAVRTQVQPAAPKPDPAPTVTAPTPMTVAAPSSSIPEPWACIAEAETGTDWSMHGSTYSTAFGMVNDIIYQYGTPSEIADVFAGTASPSEQIDIGSRFAADHGYGGWGVLTKSKCGLS